MATKLVSFHLAAVLLLILMASPVPMAQGYEGFGAGTRGGAG